MTPQIDYRAAFKSMPGPVALLTPDFVILDVNESYLEAAGRELHQIVGRNILEAFPDNPTDPEDTGPQDLRASLETVLATGDPDTIHVIRYDTEDPEQPGVFEQRYWTVVNKPLCHDDGSVAMIMHKAEEVTHLVHQSQASNC